MTSRQRGTRMAAHHTTAAALAVIVASTACGRETAPPPANVSSTAAQSAPVGATALTAPAGFDLRAVTLPDFSSAASTVRSQVDTRRAAVTAAIARPDDRAGLAAAYGELGRVLMAATYFEPAEACFVNAAQLAPTDVRWPYYLGHVFRSRGPVDQSVRWFEQARQLQPDDVATLAWLGDGYLAQGKPEAAEPLFARALALNPNAAAAHFGAGRTALARRDYATAVGHFERALALDPRATGIHYPLAMAYRGRGDLAKAESELTIKGDVEPRPADPLMREIDTLLESAEAYNVRGGAELSAGNWAAAADAFRKGLELRPTDPSLRHRLGTALAQMGDGPGAVAAFERVIADHPEFARAYFSLGVLAADTGQFEAAVRQFQQTLKYEPGYVQARVQLGWALARSGRPGESLAHFEQALAMEPTHYEAAYGYAMALVRLQRYVEARDRLAATVALYPGQPVLMHALARLLAAAPDDRVRNGRQAKALVDRLLPGGQTLPLGETTAMMLAELGEFSQAVLLQRDLIAGAQRGNLTAALPRLTANLQRYERGEPCRTPFTDDELR